MTEKRSFSSGIKPIKFMCYSHSTCFPCGYWKTHFFPEEKENLTDSQKKSRNCVFKFPLFSRFFPGVLWNFCEVFFGKIDEKKWHDFHRHKFIREISRYFTVVFPNEIFVSPFAIFPKTQKTKIQKQNKNKNKKDEKKVKKVKKVKITQMQITQKYRVMKICYI